MKRMTKENRNELIRFLICGLAAALTDYLFCQLTILVFNKTGVNIDWIALTTISTVIGFIFGVIVNYLLSTFWVYRNVDKNIKTKSVKFITLFVLFSIVAALLSIGTMLLCNVVVVYGFHEASIIEASIISLMKDYGIAFLAQTIFWTYFVAFVLKTIVGLVFNYFTRKYILYKKEKVEVEQEN